MVTLSIHELHQALYNANSNLQASINLLFDKINQDKTLAKSNNNIILKSIYSLNNLTNIKNISGATNELKINSLAEVNVLKSKLNKFVPLTEATSLHLKDKILLGLSKNLKNNKNLYILSKNINPNFYSDKMEIQKGLIATNKLNKLSLKEKIALNIMNKLDMKKIEKLMNNNEIMKSFAFNNNINKVINIYNKKAKLAAFDNQSSISPQTSFSTLVAQPQQQTFSDISCYNNCYNACHSQCHSNCYNACHGACHWACNTCW